MPDPTIFEQQMNELKTDMREVRSVLTQMANAMSKLAVLEERNIGVTAEIARANVRLSAVEVKITDIELDRAKFNGSISGATTAARVLWAVVGGGVCALAMPLLKIAVGG
jgi:hypothetical protein